MKRGIYVVIVSMILFVFNIELGYSQCEPDTLCVDTGDPGEVCPDSLPEGTVGEPYYQVVTIIPPDEYDPGTGPIPLAKIHLDTIENLPPGITYEPNATMFYPDHSYCILFSGTPTTAGTYDLIVKVTPYITIATGDTVATTQVVDDTSISITIKEPGYIKKPLNKTLWLVNYQNPFSNILKISFYSKTSQTLKFNIYNIIGGQVYSETLDIVRGFNSFEFNNLNISRGIYILNICGQQINVNIKLIKK